ncbi:hypothetical protein Tco_0336652 [Tanacetum coccineum]
MPVQTRRQLATDPEMCMFALTVSIVEPKNIKEAMADSAWIEAMQDELHQFDRLKVWELVDKPFGKMIIKLSVMPEEGIDFEESFAPVARLEADFNPPSPKDLGEENPRTNLYRSKIGSLIHKTSIKPDLVQQYAIVARYPARPTQKHLKSKAEYVGVLQQVVAQVMWKGPQHQDYASTTTKYPLYCDCQSAIAITATPYNITISTSILDITS